MNTIFTYVSESGEIEVGDLGVNLGVAVIVPACGQSWPLLANIPAGTYEVVDRGMLFAEQGIPVESHVRSFIERRNKLSHRLTSRPIDYGLLALYTFACKQLEVRNETPKRVGIPALMVGSSWGAKAVRDLVPWVAQWSDFYAVAPDVAGALALELMCPCRGRDDPFSRTALSGIAPAFNHEQAYAMYLRELGTLSAPVRALVERMCTGGVPAGQLEHREHKAPFYLWDFKINWAIHVNRSFNTTDSSSSRG